MLHPTLLVPFPGLGRSLLDRALPLWSRRLGAEREVLGWTEPEGLVQGLMGLLSQPRVLGLKQRGYAVDAALNLVVLSQAGEPGLGAWMGKAERLFTQGLGQGLEVRLHLVLFLETPEDLEALKSLPPDPKAPLATRVWPLSRWSQRGLYLPRPEHLLPWVQHFVEVLLQGGGPLQPGLGRDWAGLGVARLEWGPGDPNRFLPRLWEAVGRIATGPLPPLPDPPEPPSPRAEPPRPPRRQSCAGFPSWRGEAWSEHRRRLQEESARGTEEALLSLEEGWPGAYAREALLRGLPLLKEALSRLEETDRRLEARLREILAELDRAFGLQGQRERLRRLQARRRLGRPIDPEELQRLEEALAGLEAILEAWRVEEFLKGDAEAQEALRNLDELQREWLELKARWDQTGLPPPPPRGWRGLLHRLRSFFSRKRPDNSPSRATLCQRAWSLLEEAHKQEEVYTQRFRRFLSLGQQVYLLRAYREAVLKEAERAREALRKAQDLALEGEALAEDPLVLHAPSSDPPPGLLEAEAQTLVKEGLLELLWDGDTEGLVQGLREGGQRLMDRLPPPQVQAVGEGIWAALVEAASPRLPVRTWPEHRTYALVLGEIGAYRWGEALEEWEGRPGETVLLRILLPLSPEQLLEGLWPGAEPPSRPSPTPSPPAPPVLRDNPLLDEILLEG